MELPDLGVMFNPGHVMSLVDASVDYYEARRKGDVAGAQAALNNWNALRTEAGIPAFVSDVTDEEIAANAPRPSNFPAPDVILTPTQSGTAAVTVPTFADPPETHPSTLDPPPGDLSMVNPIDIPRPRPLPLVTFVPGVATQVPPDGPPTIIASRDNPAGPEGDTPTQIKLAADADLLNADGWGYYFQQVTGRRAPAPELLGFTGSKRFAPVPFETWWDAMFADPGIVPPIEGVTVPVGGFPDPLSDILPFSPGGGDGIRTTAAPAAAAGGISGRTLALVALVVIALVFWK